MRYAGKELELFQHATRWKKYFGSFIKPYLQGKVLEVGAGIGGTTKELCDGTQEEWQCLEPDPENFVELENRIKSGLLPVHCKAIKGTIEALPEPKIFNSILYIDVIEHLTNDKAELEKAAGLLKEGGRLIVLVPGHQGLYSAFDRAIGHIRRYNRKSLIGIAPDSLQLDSIRYLDSCGLLASAINRYLLKHEYPNSKQIKLWDKVMIPISKVTDFLTGYHVGKSLLAIWSYNSTSIISTKSQEKG